MAEITLMMKNVTETLSMPEMNGASLRRATMRTTKGSQNGGDRVIKETTITRIDVVER
jgi:hypothetical protein